MATEWSIGREVYPYQIRSYVHRYARTQLKDDPGEDYEGDCEMFRVNYGTDSRPDYDIICRGRCESDRDVKCWVEVKRLRGDSGPRFSPSDYKWSCVCPEPKKKSKGEYK